MVYPLSFSTSHCQFYISDKIYGQIDSDSFWSDEALESRLAMSEGIVGVGTQCYGPVKGELIVMGKNEDPIEYDSYDHIVEGGLELNSGILNVLDCPFSKVKLEIELMPGKYRVRIYSANLASVEGDEGDDFYKIEIWPDQNMERKVFKQYEI